MLRGMLLTLRKPWCVATTGSLLSSIACSMVSSEAWETLISIPSDSFPSQPHGHAHSGHATSLWHNTNQQTRLPSCEPAAGLNASRVCRAAAKHQDLRRG